jgi:hypothetical protein
MASELKGGSAFFPGYKDDNSPTQQTQTQGYIEKRQELPTAQLPAAQSVPPVWVVRDVRDVPSAPPPKTES